MASWDSLWYTGIGFVVAILLGLWVYLETQFKCKIRLKEVVNGRVLIKDFRARFYEDQDKSAWWRLAGEKRKEFRLIPIPPEEAIEINDKGKKFAEGYRFQTGEVVYIKDDWTVKDIPVFELTEEIKKKIENEKDFTKKKDIEDVWRKKEKEKWVKENKVISPYQPVTTNQRMSYFNNIKKAESRKTFDWKTQILPITAISGFIIIVLGFIIMFGEIAQPVLEADKIAENVASMQLETMQILRDIKTNQQTINSEFDRLSNKVDNLDKTIPD